VGNSRADFANPEHIDIKELIENAIPHFETGFPSYCERTIPIVIIQIRPKNQLMISIIHHSKNQRVNQPCAPPWSEDISLGEDTRAVDVNDMQASPWSEDRLFGLESENL
jgi:hypothetical protein